MLTKGWHPWTAQVSVLSSIYPFLFPKPITGLWHRCLINNTVIVVILKTNSTNGNKLLLRFESRAAQSRMLTASITVGGSWDLPNNSGKPRKPSVRLAVKCQAQFILLTWLPCYRQPSIASLLLLVNCEGCFIINVTWAREPLILATWRTHVLTMSCLK